MSELDSKSKCELYIEISDHFFNLGKVTESSFIEEAIKVANNCEDVNYFKSKYRNINNIREYFNSVLDTLYKKTIHMKLIIMI